jgi:hypothetical protein
MTGTIDVFDLHSGISGPALWKTSTCPNLREWWTHPVHVRCPVAQLLISSKSGQQSSKINYLVNFINNLRVVTVFWVVQDEVHQRWKSHQVRTGPPSFWQWHAMMHVSLLFLSDWHVFPLVPFYAGKNLMTAHILMLKSYVTWHVSFQPL